ncbi:MAG: mannosyltransferase family protein [Clostridia bacterium]
MSDFLNIAACVLPVLAACTAGCLLIILLVRYFVLPFRADVLVRLAGPAPVKARARKALPLGKVLATVLGLLLISRALIALSGLLFCAIEGDVAQMIRDPLSLWSRWDASHYVGLAENWYVNEGDARFHLVFFPLYPLVVRGLHLALRMDAAWAGVLVSNACLFVSGYALFRLAESQMGDQAAGRALKYLMFAPLSLFFSIPYSESMFLMLTLVAVLLAHRRHFVWAVLVGALASGTRVLGLIVAVPIFYECLLVVKEKKGGVKMALGYALLTCVVALGFVGYLYLNKWVSGDPLRFLTYQSEHWSQQMGTLWGTLEYTLKNAFVYDNLGMRLGTWMPQLAAILATMALICAAYRRVSAGDGAYALIYLYFAIAPTWLLSGARYLTAMYALYLLLAAVTRKAWQDRAVMATSILLTLYFVYMYLISGSVL